MCPLNSYTPRTFKSHVAGIVILRLCKFVFLMLLHKCTLQICSKLGFEFFHIFQPPLKRADCETLLQMAYNGWIFYIHRYLATTQGSILDIHRYLATTLDSNTHENIIL